MTNAMPLLDWNEMQAENVRISITMLDEYGLPMERRGVKIKQPKPNEAKEFSDNVASMVRDTLYELFNVES